MSGAALAEAAAALVGTPFRLHGRDPDYGIDCVGLLDAALRRIGHAAELPRHYTLRLTEPLAWLPQPGQLGFAVADGPVRPGDVIMLRPGPTQGHVAIVGREGALIHAHAGLRRVVEAPFDPAATIIAHWRLAEELD